MPSFRDQYAELFGPLPEYSPVKPETYPAPVKRRALDISLNVDQALPEPAGSGFSEQFRKVFGATTPKRAPPEAETSWTDQPKNIAAGAIEAGGMLVGAAEYGARQLGAEPLVEPLASLRRGTQNIAQDITASMTPEAQDRLSRQLLTLDPNKTIWKGGPTEVLSSLGYMAARSLPSSAIALLPAIKWFKAGMAPGAIAYLGASEGAMSMGGVANGIAQEIESTPTEELLKESPRFAALMKETGDETEARAALVEEAQGLAPLAAGVLVGIIGASAGRYLEPVFTDAGAALPRIARGYAIEAAQEAPQSGIEQFTQNVAAKTYDQNRSAWQGVGEATVSGGVVGGAIGGGFAGVFGGGQRAQRPEAAPPEAAPPVPTAPPTRRGRPPASFEKVFGKGGGPQPFERVFTMDEGAVPSDVAAAASAIRDKDLMVDLFPETLTPAAPTELESAQALAPRQEQLPLRGGEMGAVSAGRMPLAVPPVGQAELPLTRRERGYPAAQLPPGQQVAAPAEPDLTQPPGTVPSEAQLDLVTPVAQEAPPAAPRKPTAAERGVTKMEGYTVTMTDGRGNVINQDIYDTYQRAEARAEDLLNQFPDANINVEPFRQPPPPVSARAEEAPGPEPLSDILAQLDTLKDPKSERSGVYLSAPNMQRLRTEGIDQRVRGTGVQLGNFDGKGGLLIAKDRQTADTLLDMKREGWPMQTILGIATQAGIGKPTAGQYVVQVRNDKGDVTRETLVETEPEAQALADRLGENAVVMRADAAIRRRMTRIGKESKQLAKQRERRETVFAVGGEELSPQATRAVTGVATRARAGAKLLSLAARRASKEEAGRIGGFYRTNMLDFADVRQEREYGRLFSELIDTELISEMTEDVGAKKKAAEKRTELFTKLAEVRAIAKPTRRSTEVAAAARRVSPETFRTAQRVAEKQKELSVTEQEPLFETFEQATDDQLDLLADYAFNTEAAMPDTPLDEQEDAKEKAFNQIDLLFEQAAMYKAGRMYKPKKRPLIKTDEGELSPEEIEKLVGTEATAEAADRDIEDDIIERLPEAEYQTYIDAGFADRVRIVHTVWGKTSGDKLKFVRRTQKERAFRESMGAGPGAILDVSTKKREGEKRITGDFLVTAEVTKEGKRKAAYSLAPLLLRRYPQDESRENRLAREEKYKKAVGDLTETHKEASQYIGQMNVGEFGNIINEVDEDGRTTNAARSMVYARAYFRSMNELAKSMVEALNDTPSAIHEMERLNKWLNKYMSKKPRAFADSLHRVMQAESRESLVRIRPEITSQKIDLRQMALNPELRAATMAATNKRIANHVAWFQRLNDKWKTNAFYKSMIEPVMHAFSNSVWTDGWPSYRPTPEELQGIRFALNRWRQAGTTKDILYKPLRRYFTDLGFEFDTNGDLVMPINEKGEIEYRVDDKALLVAFRKKFYKTGKDTYEDTIEGILQAPKSFITGRNDLTAEQFNKQRQEQAHDVGVLANRLDAKQTLEELQKIATVNGVIDRFQNRVNNSKTTINGLISAEDRLIRAMKALGAWEDHPSPKLGKIKIGGVNKTYRIVGPRLLSKELKKEEARELMGQIKPAEISKAALKYVQGLGDAGERITRTVAEARKTETQQELDFFLKAIDIKVNAASFTKAAKLAADPLKNMGSSRTISEIMDPLIDELPADHSFRRVATRLRNLNMDDLNVQFDWDATLDDKSVARFSVRKYKDGTSRRFITVNHRYLQKLQKKGAEIAPVFLHAILHEGVHAATVGALQTNRMMKEALYTLRNGVRKWYTENNRTVPYGVKATDAIDEFVAEAFSNLGFQRTLKEIPVPAKPYMTGQNRTMWEKFVDLIKNMLGVGKDEPSTAYEAVFAITNELFTGAMPETFDKNVEMSLEVDDRSLAPMANAVYDKAKETANTMQSIWERAKVSKAPLIAMTMEQISNTYRPDFIAADGSNPLKDYMDSFFQRNAKNSRLMEVAEKMTQRWTELRQNSPDSALEFSRVGTEATLYEIAVDKPLTHRLNEHIKSDEAKARWRELSARYGKLPDAWKKMYRDTQDYYYNSLSEETSLILTNALRAVTTKGANASFTEEEFDKHYHPEKIKAMSTEAIKAEFGNYIGEDMMDTVLRIASMPRLRRGNYLPLMRYGDYVVFSEQELGSQQFADSRTAHAFAAKKREEDPTLTVGVYKLKDGRFKVDMSVKEFRTAESYTEAVRNREEMVARYGAENVSTVQKKAQFNVESAIQSNASLSTILKNLEGNSAAQAAIKNFYLRSLADSSFRKHEIHRKNRRGVDFDLQHRNFANYAKQSAYYTAQLEYGWKMAAAMADMKKFTKEHRDESKIKTVRLDEIREEIQKRDEMTADPVHLDKKVKFGVELGQFMMLTSPSYWMINATQPWLITAPWLAAKYGWGNAASSLKNAQKLIAHPLVSQVIQSRAGLKALSSKMAAEKAFGVLDQVIAQIKERAPDQAPAYTEMLEELRRYNIIDLSWIAELRDIAEGSDTTMWQKVLDSSRIMSHLTEVNNRIMTAIAAYDLKYSELLAGGHEAAHRAAIEFAADAVSTTQFNYSSANKPRLFQPGGPLGPLAPLMFQFMQWPQHMYAMLFTNLAKALKGDKEARRIIANVSATHIAAGGLIGFALQPIKWAVGLAMMALGDDDEPYDLKNTVSGETFDRLAEEGSAILFGTDMGHVLARGLPTAVGTDLSSRMSMGTLYYLDLKTDNAESMLGSVLMGMGGPVFSLGTNTFKGMENIRKGEYVRGFEQITPKLVKDFLRSYRFTTDGLKNNAGDTVLAAKDIPPQQLFLQALGFYPDEASKAYSRQAAIKDKQRVGLDSKDNILRRWRTAQTQDERSEILLDVREYNKKFPVSPITRSSLIRSMKGQMDRNAHFRRYGANISDEEAKQYSREGWYYED